MKVQDWWVKRGLLTEDNDPAKELTIAKTQFPVEYTPTVYITGDGHGCPFHWVTRNGWAGFFEKPVRENKVCCHVELFSDDVKPGSVDKVFEPVFYKGKVFGWELNVFKPIAEIIISIDYMKDGISEGEPQSLPEIRFLLRQMWTVHGMGYLRNQGEEAMRQWDKIRKLGTGQLVAIVQ